MEQDFVVVDERRITCGTLRLAICDDYSALEKVMAFKNLESWASRAELSAPESFGFDYFRKQLPIDDIFPIAILDDLEIAHNRRRQGHGTRAIHSFRLIAADYKAKLGLLRIGTFPGEDYLMGTLWRHGFYRSCGWTAFKSPPLPGLLLVWMYHLLPPLTKQERRLRVRLVKVVPQDEGIVPSEE